MSSSILLLLSVLNSLLSSAGADTASTQFVPAASFHETGRAPHDQNPLEKQSAQETFFTGIAASLEIALAEFLNTVSSRWEALKLRVTNPAITLDSLPEVPLGADWESRFVWGMYYSNLAIETQDFAIGSWVADKTGSGSVVPKQMLRSEELLHAVQDAPAGKQKTKGAERALRIYYHAKWLAERNFAKAAEWRYRDASRLALETGRKVLAAHALSRLGYFLSSWSRRNEARDVLRESERLTTKTNPLAPYLYGVLERQVAGPDIERLHAAEERILTSDVQPSEDLERERQIVIQDIHYWRAAELTPRKCFATFDPTHVTICLGGHLFNFLRQQIVVQEARV